MKTMRTIASVLTALVLALILAVPALAQGLPPAPEPVDQPDEVAELRDKYEDLSRDEIEAAGFVIPDECVSAPGLGAMGYHTVHMEKYAEQFNAGEMDPSDPPILLLDKDYKVRGVEWEAKDVGQGELELYGQAVELQPGHPGAEEPHYMMHVYFRPDGQVLMLSSSKVPPFDPELECPAAVPDNQQDGGKTPDNQQGGGDMVTKTFELTLNGTVPADAGFGVFYSLEGQDPEEEGSFVVVCGDLSQLPPEEREGIPEEDIVSDEACEGDGNTYSFEREFERGTRLAFLFARLSVTDEETFEIFHTSVDDPSRIQNDEDPLPEDFETLNTDFTNTAWYTFGGGAGDDKQDDGTGADDEQEVPDNQQDGEDKDAGAGDDQQGEMPGEMPDTGMGGLATGATIPVANVAAGLTMLVGAGYGVLRRR